MRREHKLAGAQLRHALDNTVWSAPSSARLQVPGRRRTSATSAASWPGTADGWASAQVLRHVAQHDLLVCPARRWTEIFAAPDQEVPRVSALQLQPGEVTRARIDRHRADGWRRCAPHGTCPAVRRKFISCWACFYSELQIRALTEAVCTPATTLLARAGKGDCAAERAARACR